jgi:GT2 family glycosyltransferase
MGALMIEYAVPTLNQLEWLFTRHLRSMKFNLFSRVSIIVNEIDAEKNELCAAIGQKYPVVITKVDHNAGVSKSWNHFMAEALQRGARSIVIANDDIEYTDPTALPRLCEALEEHPFAYINATHENAFSCFGMQLSLARYVGFFDEQFSPAYFEDNDYAYRLKLAGIPMHPVEGQYFHCGSATLGRFDWTRKQMHHHNFRKNAEYYVRKWGGMPGDERYTVPFQNGEDYDHADH